VKNVIFTIIVLIFLTTIAFAEVGKYQLVAGDKGAVYKINTESGDVWCLLTMTYKVVKTGETKIVTKWVEVPGETIMPKGLEEKE